jgi:hypothetical protein
VLETVLFFNTTVVKLLSLVANFAISSYRLASQQTLKIKMNGGTKNEYQGEAWAKEKKNNKMGLYTCIAL